MFLSFPTLFFQFFDFSFQFFCSRTVLKEDLLIADDIVGRRDGISHAFAVEILGICKDAESGVKFFLRIVELLLEKSLAGLFHQVPCPGMRDDADILIRPGTGLRILRSRTDRLFIIRKSAFPVFGFRLKFHSAVEESDGIGRFFRLFKNFGIFRLRLIAEHLRPTSGGRCRSRFSPFPCDGSRIRVLRRGYGRKRQRQRGGKENPETHRPGTACGRFSSALLIQGVRIAFPFRKAEPDADQEKRRCKRIDRPFDRAGLFSVPVFLRIQGLDSGFQLRDPGIGRSAAHVNSPRSFCQFGKLSFIQRAVHNISGSVLECSDAAFPIRDLNDGRLGGIPHTRDEKRYLPTNHIFHNKGTAPVQFIPVGNQQHRLVTALRGLECRQSRFQGFLDIGSSDGNGVRVQLVDELEKTGFVRGERTFQKRRPGKGDQTETIPRIQADQFPNQPFRMIQTRRLDILAQHALRCVEQHQKIPPLP